MIVSSVTISLPEMISKTKEIADKINEGNMSLAQERLDLLYKDGNQLVEAEIDRKPLLDNTLRIATDLNDLLSQKGIEGETAFLKSFSKVYRIFLELTWYQFVRRQQPIYQETKEAFIENSHRVIKILPRQEIATKFEYKCAKQAVKFLSTSENIYSKYLHHLTNLVDATSSISINQVIQAAKSLIVDVKKDWIKAWYPDIHQLRWIASTVMTIKDFNTIISPEMSHFKEKGYQYTLCLTAIFFDLIRKPEVDEDVKQLAFITLISLLSLRDEDRFSNFLTFLPQNLKPIEMVTKKADRYYLTRKMILQEIGELINNEKYSCFKNDMRKALESIDHQYQDEQIIIKRKLDELKTQTNEYENYIKETQEYLGSIQGSHRAGEGEEIQQANEDFEIAKKENENVKLEIKTIESVENTLENMKKEEEILLNKLNSMLDE